MADEDKKLEDIDESNLHQVGDFFHNLPESVHEAFARHRRSAFQKHPFFFSTLGLLGLVATWQGFDDVMERIGYFDAHPGSLLIIGLIILLLTGRLYRQLDR
ncbi:MAG: hypothetical protein WD552_01340 [Candidatus Paceibacterota bacterium]